MKVLFGILVLTLLSPLNAWTQTAEENLKQKNITLPAPISPYGTYVPAVRSGNLLFLSGHAAAPSDFKSGIVRMGKVGKDLTPEQAYQAARLSGLYLLATTRAALGSLNKVKRVLKVFGMVNSAPGFTDQTKVINGFSDLMVEVFGDSGRGGRSAVGMGSLPSQIAVEVEMILEVRD